MSLLGMQAILGLVILPKIYWYLWCFFYLAVVMFISCMTATTMRVEVY